MHLLVRVGSFGFRVLTGNRARASPSISCHQSSISMWVFSEQSPLVSPSHNRSPCPLPREVSTLRSRSPDPLPLPGAIGDPGVGLREAMRTLQIRVQGLGLKGLGVPSRDSHFCSRFLDMDAHGVETHEPSTLSQEPIPPLQPQKTLKP